MPDVNLGPGVFLPGDKVGAFERTGDFFPGSVGKSVKTATVGKDSSLVFKGLDEGPYWAVSEDGDRHVAFTSKTVPEPRKRTAPQTKFDPQEFPAVHKPEITTGATGTKVSGVLVEEPLPKEQPEAHPHLNQASVGDKVPQRSNTPLGEATPTDPGEPQPKPRQEDLADDVPQRSSTETGEATPISEDAGPASQEDSPKKLQQRSDTESGEQTPIGSAEPRGTASNPDSREVAAGERPTDNAAPANKASAAKPSGAPAKASPKKK